MIGSAALKGYPLLLVLLMKWEEAGILQFLSLFGLTYGIFAS